MAAVVQNAPRHELRIHTPDGDVRTVALEQDRYGLGRWLANELCYPNISGLAREHLVIERLGANWTVRDLGSINGTLVNGTAITAPHLLEPNDRITAGQLSLVFAEAARAAAPQTVIRPGR